MALLGCARPSHVDPPATPGAASGALPTADLLTLDRQTTQLGSVLNGRVALVSLWATWCEGCVAELDSLNRLEAVAGQSGAMVVGIAVGEQRDSVAAFVAKRGLRYTLLVDEDFRMADALGQRQVPATLVVDRHGRVRFTGGALDDRALLAFREALRDPG